MTTRSIEIIKIIFLKGPNIWTYRPALEAWVDIGELEDSPSNTLPGFYDRLTAWLPGLVEHHCGVGERGGFLLRLREGTWPAHIMEHVMIELQNLAGMPSAFGKARETGKRGVYKLVVRSRNEEVSRAALVAARDLVMAAIDDTPFDVAATIAHLRDMVDSLCIGPSTGCIVDAAAERGIPYTRLNDGNLVQLGYGTRQRRIWTAETDRTRAISESISRDKDLTKRLLQSCGVPVPEGHIVNAPEAAWEAAQDIGLPVVVKPLDGNHGRGVSTNLNSREEVEAAYHVARRESSDVIVERFVPGDEHRLLVVGGRMVAAARGEAVWIVGDGKSTVEQLIDTQINSDPRRGETEDFPLNLVLLHVDHNIRLELERQGYQSDSVPPAGKRVLVARNGNVAFDVSDRVHPEVARAASLAARIVGLDIAGVDLVAEDISRPLAEQGGAIVEVNAGPGLLMHLKPAEGESRPVGKAIVDHLFEADDSGRIPVIGIAGSRGKTAVARMLARLLQLQGAYVGLACSDGLFFHERQVEKTDCANWDAAHRALLNRSVDTAVIENGNRMILEEGLAYDRCRVGIVTNLDQAALLPEFYIDTADKLRNVIRTQVDVVLPDGVAVLNAADPVVAGLAELCDGEVMYFSTLPTAAPLQAHLAAQGRAVTVRENKVVLLRGSKETMLVDAQALPQLADGSEGSLEQVLAAVAAAWALGMSAELIRSGITTLEDLPAAA